MFRNKEKKQFFILFKYFIQFNSYQKYKPLCDTNNK